MGLPLKGASLLKHDSIKTLQMAFPERAADGLHEVYESQDEKVEKMPAF